MAALVTSGNITTARNVLYALAQLEGQAAVGGGKGGDPTLRRSIRYVLDGLTAWNIELTTDLSLTATITTDAGV
jgi:hypothetical protein